MPHSNRHSRGRQRGRLNARRPDQNRSQSRYRTQYRSHRGRRSSVAGSSRHTNQRGYRSRHSRSFPTADANDSPDDNDQTSPPHFYRSAFDGIEAATTRLHNEIETLRNNVNELAPVFEDTMDAQRVPVVVYVPVADRRPLGGNHVDDIAPSVPMHTSVRLSNREHDVKPSPMQPNQAASMPPSNQDHAFHQTMPNFPSPAFPITNDHQYAQQALHFPGRDQAVQPSFGHLDPFRQFREPADPTTNHVSNNSPQHPNYHSPHNPVSIPNLLLGQARDNAAAAQRPSTRQLFSNANAFPTMNHNAFNNTALNPAVTPIASPQTHIGLTSTGQGLFPNQTQRMGTESSDPGTRRYHAYFNPEDHMMNRGSSTDLRRNGDGNHQDEIS